MLQKLTGLKTTLWTGLVVSVTFALTLYLQNKWQVKLGLIEQVLYGIFAVGILFSAQFSRSRITLLLIVLGLFYLVKQRIIPGEYWLSVNQQWLFVTAVFSLAYFSVIKDRGLISIHGVIRLIGLVICFALAKGWLVAIDWVNQYNQQHQVVTFDVSSMVVLLPLYAVALFILYKSLRSATLFTSSLLTSLVLTNLFYQQQLTMPLAMLLSLVAMQYILVVVVDSYYLAYRDELTNLPSRRALNQYALSLGRKYCVAMIDIDHFKKFNDTYGHDIGDQVLKLVASKLGKIRAGGRVFRYGGEEFTAIFPRKTAQDATSELERLRQEVADYQIVIRHPLRKTKKARQGKASNELKTVSVTISIGVATRSTKDSFEQTVKQADLALYRAKKKGRNNVSE